MSSGLTYQLATNIPAPTSREFYWQHLHEEYEALLSDEALTEGAYQDFFERNPCMLPGYNHGNPSHGAFLWAVVSQPVIEGCKTRIADFMWLLKTSIEFTPVFIEIERPDKKAVRKCDGVQSAAYTQASEQIIDWKALLDDESTRRSFFKRYAIPDSVQRLKFSPHYILVYGRRSEFADDPLSSKKRAIRQQEGMELMTFDRLSPSYDAMGYGTVKVDKHGNININNIPPTFRFGPANAADVALWDGFNDAVDRTLLLSDTRAEFLKSRFDYWVNWVKGNKRSIVNTGDWE